MINFNAVGQKKVEVVVKTVCGFMYSLAEAN